MEGLKKYKTFRPKIIGVSILVAILSGAVMVSTSVSASEIFASRKDTREDETDKQRKQLDRAYRWSSQTAVITGVLAGASLLTAIGTGASYAV